MCLTPCLYAILIYAQMTIILAGTVADVIDFFYLSFVLYMHITNEPLIHHHHIWINLAL